MKKLLLFSITIIITSCISSKISSNKSPEFEGKIERLYILMKGSESAKPFFGAFYKSFQEQLNYKEIPTSSHYYDALSLDTEDDINKKIEGHRPNLIMTIDQTETRQTVNSVTSWKFGGNGTSNTGGTFDIKIFEPGSKTPIWRASLKADGAMQLIESANKSSRKLFEKLVEDKLIE